MASALSFMTARKEQGEGRFMDFCDRVADTYIVGGAPEMPHKTQQLQEDNINHVLCFTFSAGTKCRHQGFALASVPQEKNSVRQEVQEPVKP